jgi:hypothetical protein
MAAPSSVQQWARIAAPFLLASLAGAAVSLIVIREQVADMRVVVSKGILPITEERLRALQLELLQLRHEHEFALTKIHELESNGPVYCLRCHMRQGLNHPAVQDKGH